MAVILKVENLEKVYRLGKVKVHALRGVNMEVSKGSFIALVGPSGSGKTTLLNIVGGLDKPTFGTVYVDGEDITKMSESELTRLRRHKIGFVFQFYNLIPTLTALENVELPMLLANMPKEERIARAERLLESIGLTARMHHRPDELSGGEQQRVAIARALSNKPTLILADEPTGDLDTVTGKEIMQILYETSKQEGTTVIVVTHDPVITELAERILEIRDGKIIGEKKADGT